MAVNYTGQKEWPCTVKNQKGIKIACGSQLRQAATAPRTPLPGVTAKIMGLPPKEQYPSASHDHPKEW